MPNGKLKPVPKSPRKMVAFTLFEMIRSVLQDDVLEGIGWNTLFLMCCIKCQFTHHKYLHINRYSLGRDRA